MIPLLDDFLQFLARSKTPWHACLEIGNRLALQDFTPLDESNSWDIKPGEKYFVQRGGALIAFRMPKKEVARALILGSHTDSPALKLKPQGMHQKKNMLLCSTESYGGVNIDTWLDRDLIIAGKVSGMDQQKHLIDRLICLDEMPVIISSLATHLQKKGKEKINPQVHMVPLFGLADEIPNPQASFIEYLKQNSTLSSILSYDLFLTPREKPTVLGINRELIASHRIDNLAGAHASVTALANSENAEDTLQCAVFWNHEEIGSRSDQGAFSPFFEDVLHRIIPNESFFPCKQRSLCISVDSAHALHPHHEGKHDPQHEPLMQGGIVIKQSANQNYSTDSTSLAKIIHLCDKKEIPYQHFSPRSDMPCGTTIGPIFATALGIPTVDVGAAQLAMHSARELMAFSDHRIMCRFLKSALEETYE